MPRGYPDYNSPVNNIGAVSFDSAELAARLGSVSRIHRLGNVILATDFSENDGGAITETFSGTIIKRYKQANYGNNITLRLNRIALPQTELQPYWNVPLLDVSKVGVELNIGFDSSCYILTDYITLGFMYNTGTQLVDMTLKLLLIDEKLYILNGTGVGLPYIEIDTLDNEIISDLDFMNMYYIKLICNLADLSYDRLYFNSHYYDLSRYPCKKVANTDPKKLIFGVLIMSTSTNRYAYMDDLVITVNEP